LAKIAVELRQALTRRELHGGAGSLTAQVLAQGNGWTVEDVICTSGPRDRSFEERHSQVRIAIVVAGSFQYCAGAPRELMTPGCLLLGNADQCFECRHTHGMGDRCLAFGYGRDYFEQVAADVGAKPDFDQLRLPPLRDFSAIVAQACSGLAGHSVHLSWEELGLGLAGQALRLSAGGSLKAAAAPESSFARVARAVRIIEQNATAGHTLKDLALGDLAREARLSRYHFLRTFHRLTGLTPHKYVVRARLREAATRMADEPGKILDIALDCGFADVSTFNRAFRAEFGVSPRAYRRQRRSNWTSN
jgi:AraC family transcriptional regulator